MKEVVLLLFILSFNKLGVNKLIVSFKKDKLFELNSDWRKEEKIFSLYYNELYREKFYNKRTKTVLEIKLIDTSKGIKSLIHHYDFNNVEKNNYNEIIFYSSNKFFKIKSIDKFSNNLDNMIRVEYSFGISESKYYSGIIIFIKKFNWQNYEINIYNDKKNYVRSYSEVSNLAKSIEYFNK